MQWISGLWAAGSGWAPALVAGVWLCLVITAVAAARSLYGGSSDRADHSLGRQTHGDLNRLLASGLMSPHEYEQALDALSRSRRPTVDGHQPWEGKP